MLYHTPKQTLEKGVRITVFYKGSCESKENPNFEICMILK